MRCKVPPRRQGHNLRGGSFIHYTLMKNDILNDETYVERSGGREM
jgi:hypothetical protein